METDKEAERQLSEAVTSFLTDQMSMTPASVTVDTHPDSLVVTFCGATSLAERDCARDAQARDRIERCYREQFHVTTPLLNATVEAIVCKPIERSRLSLDVLSGDGVILFTLHTHPTECVF